MASLVPFTTRVVALDEIADRIHAAWLQADPDYDKSRRPLKTRLNDLGGRVDQLQAAGHNVDCSQQHRLEAKWLINYTADWPRAQAMLDTLEASLKIIDQPPLAQDAEGSWGPCTVEWYRKLEPTVDALQLDNIGSTELKPLRFMQRLLDGDWVGARLRELQRSDIKRTKRNNRDELGAMQTAMSQLIFKQQLTHLFHFHRVLQFEIGAALKQQYDTYIQDGQNAGTGYWGPTYLFDGSEVPVQDLSFTFHIAHYRDGDIPNLPLVIDTTLRIKNQIYPSGWKPDANTQYSDHNNYDVAMLFKFGWGHVAELQQKRVKDEILAMLKWCLTKSVDGDHFRFDGGSPIDAFYYGVRFLDIVGMWNPKKRFWTQDPIVVPAGTAEPPELCRNLKSGFLKLHASGEAAETITRLLDEAISHTAVA